MSQQLPEGWKRLKLEEVCLKITDGSHFSPKSVDNGYPYVTVRDIKNDKINFENCLRISRNDFVSLAQNDCKPLVNDLLFSKDGTVGKVSLIDFDFDFVVLSSLAILRTDTTKVFPKYLFYILKSRDFLHQALNQKKGVAIRRIILRDLKGINLNITSIENQLAIVSKIEELFSEIENGIKSLFTAKEQLKKYRQSVLNKLVSKENLLSIDRVIDKLDQGWSPKCLNEASKDKNEWAVIKTSAVQHGYFIEIENKRLPNDLKPREQHELKAGDILITRAGPRVRVGVCCMIKNTRPKLINCDKVYRIKVNGKIVAPEYFEFILNTPHYQDVIEKMKTGISDSGLNLTQKAFVQIEIPIPVIEKQKQIVEEIESRLSVADKIEEIITQSLQQADALKQSILKKAFEGRL